MAARRRLYRRPSLPRNLPRRGSRPRCSPGARLPDREAADDARRLPPEPERAPRRLQPGDEPRPGRRLRRRHAPRRAAPPRPPPLASGARAAKYRHLLDEEPGLARDEQAVLAVLMLRGPQTLNELRTRTERMQRFADQEELLGVLGRLADRGFAELQPRRPGQKEQRYAHLLSSDLDEETEASPALVPVATWTPP